MKPSIETKLKNLVARYQELQTLLSDSKVTSDLNRYRDLSKEYSQIEPYVDMYDDYQNYLQELEDAKAMLSEEDPELQQLAKQEIKQVEE